MTDIESNTSARDSILKSIREHLAASAVHDAVHAERPEQSTSHFDIVQENGNRRSEFGRAQGTQHTDSLIEIFKQNLESVGGHCVIARNDFEVKQALTNILSELQETPLRARRIALSNSATVERLMRDLGVNIDEIAIAPNATKSFEYDVGMSTAQAAIAETGTLVLESNLERHRFVSLVPPVHIAIIEADSICLTLGEALSKVGSELSPAITLITGPSRTADIELTLAIGVHGPQELFVVVNEMSDKLQFVAQSTAS